MEFIMRFVLLLAAVIGGFLLTACDNGGAALRAELESLRSEVSSEHEKSEALQQRSSATEREMTRIKGLLDDAQKDRDKMEDTLKRLNKEFSDYKEKYKVSIMKKIPGYPMGTYVVGKKTFANTQIRSIDDESMTLTHPDGIVRVKKTDMTADMVATLAMDQTTPVQLEIPDLLRQVQEHRSGKTKHSVDAMVLTAEDTSGQYTDMRAYANLLKSVALLKNDAGSGSAFVAEKDGHKYFYTNAHMMTGANPKATIVSSAGHVVMVDFPKEIEVSDEDDEGDIARFELKDSDVPALKILEDSDKLLPGQKVVALGNSGGQGVIPVLKGKTAGIGVYVVEVDAPFVHGNSGGPVLWEGTNVVIGIATRGSKENGGDRYLGFAPLPGSAPSGLRRLCVRPDKIEKWRRVSQDRLCLESKTIERINTDSEILTSLMGFEIKAGDDFIYQISYVPPKDYLYSKSELAANIAYRVRTLEADLKENKRLYKQKTSLWDNIQQTPDKLRLKQQKMLEFAKEMQTNAKQCFGNFVQAVEQFYRADVDSADPKGYCPFSRRDFKEVAKAREEIVENLGKHFHEELRQFEFDESKLEDQIR
jgi:trypsin-like peptidase